MVVAKAHLLTQNIFLFTDGNKARVQRKPPIVFWISLQELLPTETPLCDSIVNSLLARQWPDASRIIFVRLSRSKNPLAC